MKLGRSYNLPLTIYKCMMDYVLFQRTRKRNTETQQILYTHFNAVFAPHALRNVLHGPNRHWQCYLQHAIRYNLREAVTFSKKGKHEYIGNKDKLNSTNRIHVLSLLKPQKKRTIFIIRFRGKTENDMWTYARRYRKLRPIKQCPALWISDWHSCFVPERQPARFLRGLVAGRFG